MPWYRIYANHGPGHQSSTEFYRWFEKPLATKESRKDAWEGIFDDGRYDWPIGDVERVDRLPQHIYDEKVSGYWNSINHAKRMLTVLTNTKTMPVNAVRFEVVAPKKPGEKPVTGYRARCMPPTPIEGNLRPTRNGAILSLLSKLHVTKDGKSRRARKSDYVWITR